MISMNSHTRDLLILGIGKVLQVLIGLVTLRLITEILSEEQVGVYYILLTVVSLLAFGFFNPLGQFYGRHLVHWQKTENLKTATNVMLILRGIAIPFALMLAIILFYVFEYQTYFTVTEYTVFIVVSLVALIHGVLLNATNVLVSRVAFTIFAVLTMAIGLIVSILFTQLTQTAMAWIYGLAITQIFFSFILYRLIIKNQVISIAKLKRALKQNYIKGVFFFIFPVTITLFLQWGQTTSFRLVVEGLYSVEILAFIAVGMALSSAIFSALESLATQFYMPLYLKKITNATKEQRTQIWNKLASIILPIYIGVTIYVVAFAPYLTKVLVSDKFYEAFIYAMIGAMIELFRVTTNVVYMVSQSELKTKNTITPYLLGFVLMIIGLYTIDVSDALWKVTVILAFAQLMALLVMTFNMKKLLPIKFEVGVIIKSTIFTAPLLVVHFVEVQINILNSILLLMLGGLYLIATQYFLLKNKMHAMSSI